MKANKNVFYRYISRGRKSGANSWLLLNEAWDRMIEDMKGAKVLNAFFTLVFTVHTSLQQCHVPVTSWKVVEGEEHQVWEHLNSMDTSPLVLLGYISQC